MRTHEYGPIANLGDATRKANLFPGCKTSDNCPSHHECEKGECKPHKCRSIPPTAHSAIVQPTNNYEVNSEALLQCQEGHVMRLAGKCAREERLHCLMPSRNHLQRWASKDLSDISLDHCFQGIDSYFSLDQVFMSIDFRMH